MHKYDRSSTDLNAAASGMDLIVNGWNPPYTHWAQDLPGLTEQVIAAASATGATVLLPGNVYNFGEGSGPLLGQDTPQAAANPLGRLRTQMEARYRASGVQTIVLRAGDFLDTQASGNWYDLIMLKKAQKGRFLYPGDLDTPHAWAYLPDLARAAVQLAERRRALGPFTDVPFPGFTLTGRELAALTGAGLGRPLKLKRMSWLPIHLARPVWPMARHLIEMRYLWSMPHQLNVETFNAMLPGFEPTSVEHALALAARAATGAEVDPDQPVAKAQALLA